MLKSQEGLKLEQSSLSSQGHTGVVLRIASGQIEEALHHALFACCSTYKCRAGCTVLQWRMYFKLSDGPGSRVTFAISVAVPVSV